MRHAMIFATLTGLMLLSISCSGQVQGNTATPTFRPTASAPADSPTATAWTPGQPHRTLALVNGTMIDGTGAGPIRDAVLVIRDGRVAAVGSRDRIPVPKDAQVIDVGGATILPGFINAHVHAAYNLTNLKAWAQSGVTTVRDLSAHSVPPPYAIREEARQDPLYARLVSGGVMLTAPRGYPIAVFGGRAVEVHSEQEARRAANQMLDEGADILKISLESGVIFGQGIPTLSEAEVREIVAVAHERGTLVSAHVSVAQDLRSAIVYGVDDMAHMVTDPLPAYLIQQMVQGGRYWEPTLELWENVGQGLESHVIENLHAYVEAGGKVALGTDYAGYYTPFQMGMPVHEMEWMLEAGMSPMQIIIAGTQNAAHVCNLGNELGTLQANKVTDVLVLDGDPLQDLHALSAVRWVIHNGVVIRAPDE